MMEEIEINKVLPGELLAIHSLCDKDFVPPLSQRVEISDYCMKLISMAEIISYRRDGELQGVLAIYCNDHTGQTAYISSVCVHPDWRGRGVGARLLDYSISLAKIKGMKKIRLEVSRANSAAFTLYSQRDFKVTDIAIDTVFMEREIH